jgi:outer membrane protein OmpA-like peptidoglycan-associated protein
MNTRKLHFRALGLAAAACVAGLPAWAGDESGATGRSAGKHEDIGIVTGLAVGAAAGGPIGAMIGAAAGGLLGDRYHRQQQTAATLKDDLGRSEAERTRLTARVSELDGSVARLSDSLTQSQAHGEQLERRLAAVDEVGMDVSFRTDDASIKTQDMPVLLKLGALVAAMPEVQVRIAGFADPRGPDAYNDTLSLKRAEAVAAALSVAGVSRERLIVEAHGSSESTSAPGDLDAYALERRATVRLVRAASEPAASQASAGGTPAHEVASRE